MGWMIANRGTTVSLELFELDRVPVPLNSLSHSDSLVSHRTSASTARPCEAGDARGVGTGRLSAVRGRGHARAQWVWARQGYAAGKHG